MAQETMTYLIIGVQRRVVAGLDSLSYSFVVHTDPVIEVPEPDDRIVIFNASISLEAQPLANRAIICISLFVVGKASRQMSSDQT